MNPTPTPTNPESETPETDAEMRRIEDDEKQYEDRHDCYIALLKFARDLERRLAAALRERDEARKTIDGFTKLFDGIPDDAPLLDRLEKMMANAEATVVAERDAALAELARVKQCLEPGKAPAIMMGLFNEAERLGFYVPTGEHALSQFVREVTTLRADLAASQRREGEESKRLDWVLRNISGKAWMDAGVIYSANCTRADIDAALAAGSEV